MHYLADYGLFLAKAITFVVALFILMGGMMAIIFKDKGAAKTRLKVKKMNQKYAAMEKAMRVKVLSKKDYKIFLKIENQKEKTASEHRKRLYVLNVEGDIRASFVNNLREEITAILKVATPQDEVVVCLESGGGVVHGYGLGASQLQRIKMRGIPLTIIVDKIAASGAYLMACVGNKILAGPFAFIGSIGVIAQLPNFHRWLKKHNIDFEQITAGEYKRTLTLMGENTEKARQKMKESLEEVHHYFKAFIQENRPQVEIEKVSTGEYWLARKAVELKLIDGLMTSDDYLFSQHAAADIFEVNYCRKKSLSEKFSQFVAAKMQKNVSHMLI